MKAGDFDRKFDDVVDISAWLDLSKAKRAEREPLCSQEHARFIEAYNQSLEQDGLPLG
ncbi:CopG family transcriptional regulator [Methylomonas koyamae]|uniref:CopG family transcriptional regulator n=1 Tax=Methylomonas koyamae TaxID=702114 RepID=UPI000A91F739|nr:CopG family transcriptional regulator [Methylomonas koyamae]